jgi:hypothetical protein
MVLCPLDTLRSQVGTVPIWERECKTLLRMQTVRGLEGCYATESERNEDESRFVNIGAIIWNKTTNHPPPLISLYHARPVPFPKLKSRKASSAKFSYSAFDFQFFRSASGRSRSRPLCGRTFFDFYFILSVIFTR